MEAVATGGHNSYQLLEVPEDESSEEMPDSSPVPICRDPPVGCILDSRVTLRGVDSEADGAMEAAPGSSCPDC